MTVLIFPATSPVREQPGPGAAPVPAVGPRRRQRVRARASRPSVGARVVRRAPRAVECAGTLPSPAALRLTTRGRVVVTLLWVVIVTVAVLGVVRPWSEAPADDAVQSVVVQPGDSLWELAGQIAPSADPRGTVARIVELNSLASAGDIHPGDELLVPAG